MSLVEASMVDCVRVVEANGAGADGMGGVSPEWSEGARFKAALVLEDSAPERRADRDGAADRYAVTVPRAVALGFHDVFRRVSDGAVFRVISNGADNETPASAGLDMRQARAERWALPGGVT